MPVSPPSAAMASPLKAFSATLVAVLFSLVVLSLPLSHAGHSKHAPHKPHKPHAPHAPHARHVPHAPHAPHARHAPHAPHKAHDRMLGGHNPWKPRNDGGKKKPAPKNPPHPVPAPQPSVAAPGWKLAHATFYEGGSGTFGGACGYDDVVQKGYGLETAALSSVMFNNGATCGACYEIQCINSPQWCKPGKPTLTLTATNLCPPNWGLPSDNGGWCNPPREHFDIAIPVFTKIAEHKAGIVPVQYRRVPCKKQGGVRFTITGNPYFNMVLVWNVGGAGDVTCVDIKGEKTNWIPMTRNWGQKWHSGCKLTGQKLSFRVKTSDGKCVTSMNVAPANWQFGQTFEGQNFDCK